MRKLIRAAWILTASLLAPATAMAADPAIDAFEAGRQAAWNAHDAAAYAAPFDANAEIITSLGWHWTGQAEAARNLGDGFKFVYAQAHLQLSDVQVRTLTPEFSLVTLRWSIAGARTVEAAAQHGFETQIVERRGGSWLILSQQDTAAAAPMPATARSAAPATPPAAFPTSPPPVRRCIMARAKGECLIYGKAKKPPAS